ncbi:MAG: hypothetical protein F2817_13940, partial [Actinobacteria bacterium]|nr:hypothetical protein [Actinomycetota bacterium]
MDRRVASFLDHARRELAAGRPGRAEGLERQAMLAAESLPDGREERAAVLVLRTERLIAQGEYSAALTATVQARPLVTAPEPSFALRMDEARLRLLLGDDGVRALIEGIVADGVAGGRASWPMARAYGLLGRACERDGDGRAAREARARGRRLLSATPDPPRALVEALEEPG